MLPTQFSAAAINTSSGALPAPAPIPARLAGFVALFRRDRVRHAKTQVMVSVHAGLRFWFQHCFQGAETVTDIAHVHRTARIHYINAGRTVSLPSALPAWRDSPAWSYGSSSENQRCPVRARGHTEYAGRKHQLRYSALPHEEPPARQPARHF